MAATHAAPAAPRTRRVLKKSPAQYANRPINDLRSGPQMGNHALPDNTVDTMSATEIRQLAQALRCETSTTAEAGAVKHILASFARDLDEGFARYDNSAFLQTALVEQSLSPAEIAELAQLAEQSHMAIATRAHTDVYGMQTVGLSVFFDGTKLNARDLHHDLRSALGMTGSNDRAARRIGELFTKVLRSSDFVHLDVVAGLSMGGGAAQTFVAGIEGRAALIKPPPVILLDPQLLNDRQARFAKKGAHLPVDFAKPRGVAITLDYTKRPHRGLMSKMKTFGGYRSPGLIELQLGLGDSDGDLGSAPKPTPPGLGYHGHLSFYAAALSRFCGPPEPMTQIPNAAVIDLRHAIIG